MKHVFEQLLQEVYNQVAQKLSLLHLCSAAPHFCNVLPSCRGVKERQRETSRAGWHPDPVQAPGSDNVIVSNFVELCGSNRVATRSKTLRGMGQDGSVKGSACHRLPRPGGMIPVQEENPCGNQAKGGLHGLYESESTENV